MSGRARLSRKSRYLLGSAAPSQGAERFTQFDPQPQRMRHRSGMRLRTARSKRWICTMLPVTAPTTEEDPNKQHRGAYSSRGCFRTIIILSVLFSRFYTVTPTKRPAPSSATPRRSVGRNSERQNAWASTARPCPTSCGCSSSGGRA